MDEKTGWLVGGASAISVLLTVLLTKGVPAFNKLRDGRLKERKQEHDQTVEGYQMTIQSLETRVLHLETLLDAQQKTHASEMDAMRKEHIECIRQQTKLAVQNEHQAQDIVRLDSEIQSLREWRHTISNAAQLKQAGLQDSTGGH